jgi:hypothetical protein
MGKIYIVLVWCHTMWYIVRGGWKIGWSRLVPWYGVSVWYHGVISYCMVQYGVILCGMVWCRMVTVWHNIWCNVLVYVLLQYGAVWYGLVEYGMIWYNVLVWFG